MSRGGSEPRRARRGQGTDKGPGKPDQNAYIERFNRSYRQDVLDAYVFGSLEEVRAVSEEWIEDYNTERPHDSLGRVPTLTFLPRLHQAWSTLSTCLLDGEAYGIIEPFLWAASGREPSS